MQFTAGLHATTSQQGTTRGTSTKRATTLGKVKPCNLCCNT